MGRADQPEAPNVLFVPGYLDDLGLRPMEFRVLYAVWHGAAKADGVCRAGLESIAAECRLGITRTRDALRNLEADGLIAGEQQLGKPTRYVVTLENVATGKLLLPFIHSDLAALGLHLMDFRIYATITRRTNGDLEEAFYEALDNAAARCRMSETRTRDALKVLEADGLIAGEQQVAKPTRYVVTPRSAWTSKPGPETRTPPRGAPLHVAHPSTWRTPPLHVAHPTPPRGAPEVTLLKLPSKEQSLSAATTEAIAEPQAPRLAPRERNRPEDEVQPQPQKPQPKPEAQEQRELILEAWNANRGRLPKARELTPEREKAIAAWTKRYGSAKVVEMVRGATVMMAKDTTCQVANNGTGADLDYLIGNGGRWGGALARFWELYQSQEEQQTARDESFRRLREMQDELDASAASIPNVSVDDDDVTEPEPRRRLRDGLTPLDSITLDTEPAPAPRPDDAPAFILTTVATKPEPIAPNPAPVAAPPAKPPKPSEEEVLRKLRAQVPVAEAIHAAATASSSE